MENKYEVVSKEEFRELFAIWNNERADEKADEVFAIHGDDFNEKIYALIKSFVDSVDEMRYRSPPSYEEICEANK